MKRIMMSAVVALASPALAGFSVPVVEDFELGASNWHDSTGAADATWNSSGSFDGSGYVSADFNFANSIVDETPLLFRAQDEYSSSGGAFVGDWAASGATEFSMWVRHNASSPLNFFVRFASPANFPGAVALEFIPVQSGEWTQISFDLSAMNPEFLNFEGSDFDTVFSNIGHIQIGISVPAALEGVDETFTFDLDQVSLVPAPGALPLATFGALALIRRRR